MILLRARAKTLSTLGIAFGPYRISECQRFECRLGRHRKAPNEALVNALSMMSPYGTAEKQALLEAPDLKTRAEILIAITEIELAKNTEGASRNSVIRNGAGRSCPGHPCP